MTQSNNAAWTIEVQANPLQVKESAYPSAGANELVVKSHAIAINPIDVGLQDHGQHMFQWLKYPFIFGSDLAGEVVEVGSEVSGFKTGDRVLALAVASDPDCNNPAHGAFQNYSLVRADLATKIPSSLAYDHAAVLPLGLATAASGLFPKDFLGLQLPTVPAQPSTGQVLIVWGGSTSVGSNAIQLAVAAGYEVFTTASPRNFDYVKRLGASQAFDYKDENVVQKLIDALKNKTVAGAFAIGEGSTECCSKILSKANGAKFIADVNPRSPPIPEELGVSSKFVWGSDLKKSEVGPAIFSNYLTKALETGNYISAPEPEVIGQGLENVQKGIDTVRNGVSAKKIVVTL
jgi:NADPH:quinone reductase-like Zn-dependent oxidoreductase